VATFSQRLDALLARDHDRVGEKGRTLAYIHGERRPRAVVLLHGMTASPPQFERFARALFLRGHNVIVPRLPHHGHADRLSTALESLRPTQLYEATCDYVSIAAELGDRVTVAGFSLGGLLAAWSAQHHFVDRSVAIAPFLGVSWIPSHLMTGVAEMMLRVPNRFHWWNPVLRERQMPAHGYPRYATHAVAHAYRMAHTLLHDARTRPPSARHVVIVANAAESTVNNRAVRRLHALWRAHQTHTVELVTLTGLPISHDIIEPLRRRDVASRAFPQILDAIDPQI
jgi:alpha-beta hydrolase superfamily lysophospholipase